MELAVSVERSWSKEGKKDILTQGPAKTSPTGVTLIPQPSDDAKDPLVSVSLHQSAFVRATSLLSISAF